MGKVLNTSVRTLPIYFIIIFFMFINSGFYIQFFPAFSPVYIFFYLGLLFTFIYIALKQKIRLPKSSLLGCLVIFYVLTSQFILGGRPEAILGSVATMLFYVIGTILLPCFSIKKYFFITDSLLCFMSFIYGADTIYRLSLFGFNVLGLMKSFYQMKVECFLYGDTNPLAVSSATLLFFAFYLYQMTKLKKYFYYVIIFSIITFLTFSRSAIIATIIVLFAFYIFKILKYLQTTLKETINISKIPIKITFVYFTFILFIIFGLYIGKNIIIYLMSDGSFMTKLDLFSDTIHFFTKAPINDLLLGIGFNNGRILEYSTRGYAHAYLTTYILETGIIGYILVTSFLIYILNETKMTWTVIVAFFIMGISYIGHSQLHLFYAVLALIWNLEHNLKKEII